MNFVLTNDNILTFFITAEGIYRVCMSEEFQSILRYIIFGEINSLLKMCHILMESALYLMIAIYNKNHLLKPHLFSPNSVI